MIEKLTHSQLNEYYNRVSENGIHGLKGIEYFQAKQLLQYCEAIKTKKLIKCAEMHEAAIHSNYSYPKAYQNGREFEYWTTVISDFNLPDKVIAVIEEFLIPSIENDNSPTVPKPKNQGLSLRQIALIYFYNGLSISRENGNDIARQYNHNSGEKLFQHFCFYSSVSNRKGRPTPCTPKKLKNKIELFESILHHLKKGKENRAIDEINILKAIYDHEYQ